MSHLPRKPLTATAKKPRHHIVLIASSLLFVAHTALAQPVAQSGEIEVNLTTAGLQIDSKTAMAEDATFVVVWTSGGGQDGDGVGVFLRRFDVDGSPLTGEVMVNTFVTDAQEDPDIAMADDGSFIVVWDSDSQDGEARGVYGQLFDASAAPVGGEFQLSASGANDQNDPVVALMPDGGFVVAWETSPVANPSFEDLVVRRFDAAGVALTGEVAVNSTLTGDQEDVDIGTDVNGNSVLVWESDGQDGDGEAIIARRFDSDLLPLAAELQINASTAGDQSDPSLAVANDGTFVVTWDDDTQDNGFLAPFGRYFAADGTATSAEFQLDMDPGPQGISSAALDSQGRLVASWNSLGQDGDIDSVIMNHFDTSGQPTGEEQIVNVTTAGAQFFPWVAINSGDEVVVSWDGENGSDPNFGISARRYAIALFADGFESGDTTVWSAEISQ